MVIKSAEFIKSTGNDRNYYVSDYPEVAFVGRSNVGKSSLINFIARRRKLANTSATPGKTKLINYFLINKTFLLVDLPGYGYAQVSRDAQGQWAEFLDEYLKTSKNLKCVYLLLDVRRTPTAQDEQMLKYLYANQIPTVLVVTKTDTLSKSQVNNQLMVITAKLGVNKSDLILTSSQDKKGYEQLMESIEKRISVE